MKILFIGDIVGSPGRKILKENLSQLKRDKNIDYCIANGENAAAGSGVTYTVAKEIYKAGVDFITLGNHTWAKREILHFIDSESKMIRPANYAPRLPGKGFAIVETTFGKIGIINLMGRVFMDLVDCPFRVADQILEDLKKEAQIIIVDFHAEATSEKIALAHYLDGRVSAVVGTHTHVQTADERILDCQTGYITDVGMTGPFEGVIGVEKEIIIDKFMKGLPSRFEVAKGRVQFNGIVLEIEEKKGRTIALERLSFVI